MKTAIAAIMLVASTLAASANVGASILVQNYVDPSCMRPDEDKLTNHHCYQGRDGSKHHSPSPTIPYAPPPVGASAQCNDGTYSFSEHRSGTCSHHGGIAN